MFETSLGTKLENNKATFEIRNYIQNPLSEEELKTVIQKLNIKPIELVRIKEKDWTENFKGKTLSDKEIIEAMIQFPKLI